MTLATGTPAVLRGFCLPRQHCGNVFFPKSDLNDSQKDLTEDGENTERDPVQDNVMQKHLKTTHPLMETAEKKVEEETPNDWSVCTSRSM